MDGSGNVVVTGHSNHECYTAKYAAADGTLLWVRYLNGVSGLASSLALGPNGIVAVTGSPSGPTFNSDFTGISNGGGASGYDFYTAKYAAADGAMLWEKRYNGPANSEDRAKAVAVDGSGNVLVTGYSYDANYTNSDYYTAKYAAANGALLWEQRYNGPGNRDDQARAVAVDGSGNVLVTGYSYDANNTNSDYYTAKYAAADGAMLWEKRYNGPANGYDDGSSLALGPNGMVAVTGSSDGNFSAGIAYDYATVVYREIPPPLSYAGWAACSGLTGAAAAADADPDSDGLPNGAEYILGGIPTAPGTFGGAAVTTSGGNMVFSFPRDDESETSDVTLTVETGTDLMTWPTVFTIGSNTAASSPGVSITENGSAPDTITVTIAQGTNTHLFARLKVTVAP